MRIRVERRGGFAGVPAHGERDEANLSTAERDAAARLLRSPPPSAPAAGADRFTYHVTIEQDDQVHHLTVPEDAMPEPLAAIPKIKL
jgi:hypothetical protein